MLNASCAGVQYGEGGGVYGNSWLHGKDSRWTKPNGSKKPTFTTTK